MFLCRRNILRHDGNDAFRHGPNDETVPSGLTFAPLIRHGRETKPTAAPAYYCRVMSFWKQASTIGNTSTMIIRGENPRTCSSLTHLSSTTSLWSVLVIANSVSCRYFSYKLFLKSWYNRPRLWFQEKNKIVPCDASFSRKSSLKICQVHLNSNQLIGSLKAFNFLQEFN